MKSRNVWAMGLLLALASSARANLLINGSLETTAKLNSHGRVLLSSTSPANTLPGWALTQGTVDLLPSSYWQPSNGRFSVDLIGTPGLGGISQTVTGLTIGTDYELTFDFAINPDQREKSSGKIMQVQAVGSAVLVTQTYQRTKNGESKSHMHYTHESIQFTADSTSVTITFSALPPLNLPGGLLASRSVVGPVLDNVDLEAAGGGGPQSPEPASLGVLGLGGLLLLRRRRK